MSSGGLSEESAGDDGPQTTEPEVADKVVLEVGDDEAHTDPLTVTDDDEVLPKPRHSTGDSDVQEPPLEVVVGERRAGSEGLQSDSFEELSPVRDGHHNLAKSFREDMNKDYNLLEHYERADLELSLPPPGRMGAVRDVPVIKQKGDLEVSIDDYKKHVLSPNESFISYKITIKTSRLNMFDQSEYKSWRRYSDFEWLRKELLHAHPSLIIPPLPGKQISKFLDFMNPEFIAKRRTALAIFLSRLAEHPILTFDKTFKVFLTASPQDLTVEQVASINPSFWSGLTQSVQKATMSFWLKNPDQEFVKHTKYISSLSDKLALLERSCNRMQDEREALVVASKEFSPVVNSWANSEMLLEDPLAQLAKCNDSCCQAAKQLNNNSVMSFQQKVKEYQSYCTTVQSALKNRDRLQIAYDAASEEKARKLKALDEAKNAGKDTKIDKLEKDAEAASEQCEKAMDALEKCNCHLRMDLEHWHKQKDTELCKMMTETADDHINYHQKCFNKWEDLLRVLKDFKSTSTVETVDYPSSSSSSSSDLSATMSEENN